MRADLLRLTPEALTQLANAGLVKRAQRELAGGYQPVLTLDPDGRLSGLFPDQVRTEFGPGAGLKEAKCSCGAALCRHRLALVLHYAASASAAAESEGAEVTAAPALPGFTDLDQAALQTRLGPTLWARVQRDWSQGIRIEVERTPGSGGAPVYTARLPQATARFYAGADLAFARCDCVAQQHCEHIALGALALKEAETRGLADARMSIELHSGDVRKSGTAGFDDSAVQALLSSLLCTGLAHGAAASAASAAALTAALAASRSLGATWLTLCLEDLEQWLDAYQRRSARFSWSDGVALLGELLLRIRVAQGSGGELSARTVLGLSEALETPLDRLSLLSLGLRVDSDGTRRLARLALVDCDTQTVLCLYKSWEKPAEGGLSELALLDQQRVATSLRLGRLASGSLVTTSARRRANGELKLGQSFAGKASIGSQNGDWSALRPPLLIEAQADYLRQQRLAAPLSLAARTALPGFHVLRVGAVVQLGFDPARQCLRALLADLSGAIWTLSRDYASATPGALDAIAATLQSAQPQERPLYIAGRVLRIDGELMIEPWALSSGALLVPDLSPVSGALANVAMHGVGDTAADPLVDFLQQLDELLCDLLREGWRKCSATTRGRLATLIARCREIGLAADGATAVGPLLGRLFEQLQSIEPEPLAAVSELLVWSSLARHALSELDGTDDSSIDPETDQ